MRRALYAASTPNGGVLHAVSVRWGRGVETLCGLTAWAGAVPFDAKGRHACRACRAIAAQAKRRTA